MRWEVYVLWNSDGGTGWGNASFGRMEMTGEEVRQLKDAWAATNKKDPSFYRHVFIPYHRPVLGYVAGWVGLVFWRSRRYRALAKAE
jgi:hypothetical protein